MEGNSKLGIMRVQQGDLLKELGEDPTDDYIAGALILAREGCLEDALKVASAIENYGNGLEEEGMDPKRSYYLAASLYAQIGALPDLLKVEKKIEKLASAGSLEEKLKNALKTAREQLEELRQAYKKEKEDLLSSAAKGVVKDMIPLLDSFEIALSAMKGADLKVIEGVQLVYNQMYCQLEKEGLQRIDTKEGDQFNPVFHDAEGVVRLEQYNDNAIVAVTKSGYMFKGQILRAAKVIVNKVKE